MLNFKIKLPLVKLEKSKPTSNIIEKDAEGVVVEDSSTGVLSVFSNNNYYPIHTDSNVTKGKRRVYAKDSEGRWYEWDRPCFEDRYQAPDRYLPYRPKLMVKGNIIKDGDDKIFKIKVCWNKNNLDDYDKAMKMLENMKDD